MQYSKRLRLSAEILNKAAELGASLAGICSIEELKKAPSFTLAPRLPKADVGSRESDLGLKPGEVFWPPGAKSAVVIAFAHPEGEPNLDWWYGKSDPPGNKVLVKIIEELSSWVTSAHGVKTFPLPYHVEKGGTFLKDAAVLAGLGCMGKNNILVTPQYGPRVRLRAMLLAEELPSTGPREFNPCAMCEAPCLKSCPQEAFARKIYSSEEMGQEILPGLVGIYDRERCNIQMNMDTEAAREEKVPEVSEKPVKIIKYCRNCELSCPVGK